MARGGEGAITAPAGILPGRRVGLLLGLVVVLALGIRIQLLRTTAPVIAPPPAVSDAAAYRLLGQGLAEGEGYVRPFDRQRQGRIVPTAEYPPGYPAVLAAAELVGLDGERGQRAILALVGSLTVGLVGLVGRRLGGDAVGLLAAVVAAVHPSLWSTDTSPLAEPLAAFAGTAAVLAALAIVDRPDRWWRWALLGGIAGLGGLVRTELLLIGPLLLLPLAWRCAPGDRRRQLATAGLGLVALAGVLAPWTLRNAVVFGDVVLVSNNIGSVARGANCDGAYRGEFKGLWVTNVADVGGDQVDPAGRCFTGFEIGPGEDEADAAGRLRSEGVRYALDHADELPEVVAARLGRTTGLYRFEQQVNFGGLEGRTVRWDRPGTRLFQVLGVVALAGAVAPWRRGRGTRWVLVVPLVAVAATVAATYGNLRFRAVADPVVVVLAALAVGDLLAHLGGRRSPSSVRTDGAALSEPGGTPR